MKAQEIIDYLTIYGAFLPAPRQEIVKSYFENVLLSDYNRDKEHNQLFERMDTMGRLALINTEINDLERQRRNAEENLNFQRTRLELIAKRIFDLEKEKEKTELQRDFLIDHRPEPDLS